MSLEDGQQVLPTQDFDDFADETKAETAEVEDQINAEQELNDDNVAQLEADEQDENDTAAEGKNDDAGKETADETTEESSETRGSLHKGFAQNCHPASTE